MGNMSEPEGHPLWRLSAEPKIWSHEWLWTGRSCPSGDSWCKLVLDPSFNLYSEAELHPCRVVYKLPMTLWELIKQLPTTTTITATESECTWSTTHNGINLIVISHCLLPACLRLRCFHVSAPTCPKHCQELRELLIKDKEGVRAP